MSNRFLTSNNIIFIVLKLCFSIPYTLIFPLHKLSLFPFHNSLFSIPQTTFFHSTDAFFPTHKLSFFPPPQTHFPAPKSLLTDGCGGWSCPLTFCSCLLWAVGVLSPGAVDALAAAPALLPAGDFA